jgi:hypothetical protein
VVTAHIKAGVKPEASGRHIIVSKEATLLDIANIVWKHFNFKALRAGRMMKK